MTAGRKIESQILDSEGFGQESISVEGIKGRGVLKTMLSIIKLPWSLLQSINIIRRASPDIILGVGGYSSGPLCLSGKLMGLPVVLHEQNSYPGLTNRLLCRLVDQVFISFEEGSSTSSLKSPSFVPLGPTPNELTLSPWHATKENSLIWAGSPSSSAEGPGSSSGSGSSGRPTSSSATSGSSGIAAGSGSPWAASSHTAVISPVLFLTTPCWVLMVKVSPSKGASILFCTIHQAVWKSRICVSP